MRNFKTKKLYANVVIAHHNERQYPYITHKFHQAISSDRHGMMTKDYEAVPELVSE